MARGMAKGGWQDGQLGICRPAGEIRAGLPAISLFPPYVKHQSHVAET